MAILPKMIHDAVSGLEELSPEEILRVLKAAYPTEAKRLPTHAQ